MKCQDIRQICQTNKIREAMKLRQTEGVVTND